MGFSWSSAVAQETLLRIAEARGLTDSVIWSPVKPLPPSWELGFAVATDDMMIFSDAGPGRTLEAARGFETALVRHGAVKHPEQDLDDALNACCLVIDLVDGTQWHPPASRLLELLSGVVNLSTLRRCSPGALAGYLGVSQWFCLLRRLRLSVFDGVYSFCSGVKTRDRTVVDCPADVLTELLADAALFCFGAVDMTVAFLPLVGATDASTV